MHSRTLLLHTHTHTNTGQSCWKQGLLFAVCCSPSINLSAQSFCSIYVALQTRHRKGMKSAQNRIQSTLQGSLTVEYILCWLQNQGMLFGRGEFKEDSIWPFIKKSTSKKPVASINKACVCGVNFVYYLLEVCCLGRAAVSTYTCTSL